MIRIGIIGIKGYKYIYSGFETFVRYLVKKSGNNYHYTLFSRAAYQRVIIKKARFISLPILTLRGKYLETFSYALSSFCYSLKQKIDLVLFLGLSSTPLIFLHKILGRKVLVNVDGLDWERKRWSIIGKLYLKICERLTCLFADIIICDSLSVLNYYKNKYKLKNLKLISYGAETIVRKPGIFLKRLHVEPREYFLFVGRIVPENSIDELIKAFKLVKSNFKCIILGASIYEDQYKNYLDSLVGKDKRIMFLGVLIGKKYQEICSNAFAYVETKSVGGAHPSLIEALSFGNFIIAKDLPFHKEVVNDAGIYYVKNHPVENLYAKMRVALHNPSKLTKFRALAKKRSRRFSWTTVIKDYEETFNKLIY